MGDIEYNIDRARAVESAVRDLNETAADFDSNMNDFRSALRKVYNEGFKAGAVEQSQYNPEHGPAWDNGWVE